MLCFYQLCLQVDTSSLLYDGDILSSFMDKGVSPSPSPVQVYVEALVSKYQKNTQKATCMERKRVLTTRSITTWMSGYYENFGVFFLPLNPFVPF